MRKVFLTFAAIYTFGAINNLNAQIAMHQGTFTSSLITFSETLGENRDVNTSNIDIRAVNHFKKQFASAENESWTKVSDGFIARFFADAVDNRIGYDKKGRWVYSIYVYNENKLPASVRTDVKYAFGNYTITSAEEVHVSDKVVYLVHITDATTLKTVRVADDSMEIVETYKKG